MTSRLQERLRALQSDPEYQFELLAVDVAEQIAVAMEALHLSQKDLADRLGVSQPRVSQILGGDENLTLKTLVAVAAALGGRLSVSLDVGVAEPVDR